MKIAVCGEKRSTSGFGRVSTSLKQAFCAQGADARLIATIAPTLRARPEETWQGELRKFQPECLLVIGGVWTYPRMCHELRQICPTALIIVYFVTEFEVSKEAAATLHKADRIVVPTAWAQNEVHRCDPSLSSKTHVIPHGLDHKVFSSVRQNESAKQKARDTLQNCLGDRGVPLAKTLILNGNTDTQRKRLDFSIRAFKEFQNKVPDSQLILLAPPGREKARLAKTIRDERMAGKVLHVATNKHQRRLTLDQLNAVYNACDIGLNTAINEGWGLVSWEHGATAAPQCVPDTPVLREIWQDSAVFLKTEPISLFGAYPRTGYIVDIEAAAKALVDLCQAPLGMAHIGGLAEAHVRQPDLSWNSIAKAWLGVVKNARQATQLVV